MLATPGPQQEAPKKTSLKEQRILSTSSKAPAAAEGSVPPPPEGEDEL